MPFVPVPKDLSKVKTKIALGLTKRQLICFSCAAAVGVPTYLFTRTAIGSSAAVFLMMGLMLPFFFLAMFEKDDQPAEKILRKGEIYNQMSRRSFASGYSSPEARSTDPACLPLTRCL